MQPRLKDRVTKVITSKKAKVTVAVVTMMMTYLTSESCFGSHYFANIMFSVFAMKVFFLIRSSASSFVLVLLVPWRELLLLDFCDILLHGDDDDDFVRC